MLITDFRPGDKFKVLSPGNDPRNIRTVTRVEDDYITYSSSLNPGVNGIATDTAISALRIEIVEMQKELSEHSEAWRQSERAKELKAFFDALDTADGSWLAEEENRLEITESEWREYRRTKAELAEARYAASPF